jgi:hypothetical protein
MVVELTPAEVSDLLEMSLVPENSESWADAIFATDRPYTGWVRDHKFDIRPIWRNRRFQPTMTGRFDEVEEGRTRIEFQIHMDSKVLIPFIIPLVLLIPIAAVVISASIEDMENPAGICVCLAPVFVVGFVAVINALFARNESTALLHFFENMFRRDRIA